IARKPTNSFANGPFVARVKIQVEKSSPTLNNRLNSGTAITEAKNNNPIDRANATALSGRRVSTSLVAPIANATTAIAADNQCSDPCINRTGLLGLSKSAFGTPVQYVKTAVRKGWTDRVNASATASIPDFTTVLATPPTTSGITH